MKGHVLTMLLGLLIASGCNKPGAESGHSGEHHDDHGDHKESHGEHKGHKDHGEEEGNVVLSKEAMARVEVGLQKVVTGSLEQSFEIQAEVLLNPDRVAHMSPLVEGQLLQVGAKVGDMVKAEQPLATLRSVSLGKARAEYARSRAKYEMNRQTVTRQERLRKDGINSKRSLLEAQLALSESKTLRDAARSQLRVFGVRGGSGPDMTLASPIGGQVLERHATRGENVGPSDVLFVIADLSKVWVIGTVYEQQISQVKPGMPATLTLNAYPGKLWQGKVDYVGASLNKETRTLPIRMELENPEQLLRPGLFGSLKLAVGEGVQGGPSGGPLVLLPAQALQRVESRDVVFVPGEKRGEFEVRVVTLGRRQRDVVEVVQGLKEGESVVVTGAFVLKSELMRSQLGHGHAH